MPFAGDPVFASTLLRARGVDGVRQLLLELDGVGLGEESALARLLAASFGAAARLTDPSSRVTEVLDAQYVDPEDPSWLSDDIALGLAIVARAGAAHGAGPSARTLGGWGRQVLAREAAIGSPTSDRLGLHADDRGAVPDPLLAIARAVAASGDGTGAAAMLPDQPSWSTALARQWADGGAALAGVVALLDDSGDAAGRSVRAGLEALGTGLDDGFPDDWTVDRDTAAAVTQSLGAAVAAHVSAVTGLFTVLVERCPEPGELGALRGLGYLTVDSSAALAIERGMVEWWRDQPEPVAGDAEALLGAVVVPAGYLAVRDYGQRLAHALETHRLSALAERSALRWEASVGLAVDLLLGKRAGPAEPVVNAVEDGIQRWVGADGRFRVPEDRGLAFEPADAAWRTAGGVRTSDEAVRRAHAGADAFTLVRGVLGRPAVAEPDDTSLWEVLTEDLLDSDRPARNRSDRGGGRPR
jgi:hypothetical protein